MTTVGDRADYAARRTRTEAALTEAGLDMLLAYSVRNQPGPAGFLSGYEPRFGFRDVAVVTLVPGGAMTLFAYAYWDAPATHTWIEDVVVEPNIHAMARRIAEAIPSGAKRIGIAGQLFLPGTFIDALKAARPDCVLVDATALLTDLAKVKSPAEIDALRECARMTDAGVRAFLEGIRPGADERRIALDVERAMVLAGAERLAFPVLLFSGPLVEVGIGYPSATPLVAGQQVNIVCGALNRNYNMDIARVTTVGPPSPEYRRAMETAAEMHAAMLESVKPGAEVQVIGAAGMKVLHERGMDDWSYQGGPAGYAGHGIGCWLDEPPTLKLGETTPIEPGMVLILEARLAKRGHGGAHITDPIVVTQGGAERLGSVPIATWLR
jgi:Xaa-Pro aminopeptidase